MLQMSASPELMATRQKGLAISSLFLVLTPKILYFYTIHRLLHHVLFLLALYRVVWILLLLCSLVTEKQYPHLLHTFSGLSTVREFSKLQMEIRTSLEICPYCNAAHSVLWYRFEVALLDTSKDFWFVVFFWVFLLACLCFLFVWFGWFFWGFFAGGLCLVFFFQRTVKSGKTILSFL